MSRHVLDRPLFALKIMFLYVQGSGLPSNTWLWANPSPYPTQHVHRFSRFCRAHDRDGQRPYDPVCKNRPHLPSTALRPNNATIMFVMLSSRQSHCESSPGSFDECTLSDKWPSTFRPNQPIWTASPPVGCHRPYPPSPFIIITQPES